MEHPENSGEYKGLAVNKGIEQPSSVNPYLKRKPKKRQLSVAEFVEGIVKGDYYFEPGCDISGKCETGTSGRSTRGDREMPASFRKFCPYRYQRSSRRGKEYFDRCIRFARA